MKKKWMAALVALGLFIAIPVAVYAADYAGEYDLTIKLEVVSADFADAQVTSFEATSEPMGVMTFWSDLLKGWNPDSIEELGNYTVFVEVTQGSDVDTQSQSDYILFKAGTRLVEPSEPVPFTFEFHEKRAGEADVRVYIEYVYTATVVFDYTWRVMVS